MPTAHDSTPEALAATTRRRRESLEAAKRQYQAGALTYDDLAQVATAFCDAFYAYQVARYGKARRLDYRAVIR